MLLIEEFALAVSTMTTRMLSGTICPPTASLSLGSWRRTFKFLISAAESTNAQKTWVHGNMSFLITLCWRSSNLGDKLLLIDHRRDLLIDRLEISVSPSPVRLPRLLSANIIGFSVRAVVVLRWSRTSPAGPLRVTLFRGNSARRALMRLPLPAKYMKEGNWDSGWFISWTTSSNLPVSTKDHPVASETRSSQAAIENHVNGGS